MAFYKFPRKYTLYFINAFPLRLTGMAKDGCGFGYAKEGSKHERENKTKAFKQQQKELKKLNNQLNFNTF